MKGEFGDEREGEVGAREGVRGRARRADPQITATGSREGGSVKKSMGSRQI